MIKSKWAVVLMGVVILFMVSSCATEQPVPTEPLKPGEVRLLKVSFPEIGAIKKMVKYVAEIKFEADGRPEITRGCVYWNVYGPSCMGVMEVSYGPGIIRLEVPTPMDGLYTLKAFVYYVRGGVTIRSNMVEAQFSISP
jgi:hypothetical protein